MTHQSETQTEYCYTAAQQAILQELVAGTYKFLFGRCGVTHTIAVTAICISCTYGFCCGKGAVFMSLENFYYNRLYYAKICFSTGFFRTTKSYAANCFTRLYCYTKAQYCIE